MLVFVTYFFVIYSWRTVWQGIAIIIILFLPIVVFNTIRSVKLESREKDQNPKINLKIKNLDKLKSVHPAFGKVTKSTVLNGFGAPLHPGALKYYREIGVPGIEDFVKKTSN